jgi:ribosome-binding ATPase YchF (GTP1/OBG family)
LDDIDVINLELALADLAAIEKRLERLKKGDTAGGLGHMCTWSVGRAEAGR